jgi:outer membrane protein assembly factor BamB
MIFHFRVRQWVQAVVLLLVLAPASAANDWPQFRGPDRTGISAETGLLKKWPAEGPELLWQYAELGDGYSSVAVAGERVYTAGGKNGQVVVTALDGAGKKVWETPIGGTGTGQYAGTRATPTVDGDRLYMLGDNGDLTCLKTADGAVVWTKNILAAYAAPNTRWKLAESALVDGDRVICCPGGNAAMVALDKSTGEQVWATEPVDKMTGYAAAIVIEQGGLRQIVGSSSEHVFGVRAEDGKLLWKQEQKVNHGVNATTVAFDKGIIFSSCGYGWGSQALKLTVRGDEASVKQVFTLKDLDDHFGGLVMVKGVVFGTASRGSLFSIRMANGQVGYKSGEVGKSSSIYADGRLYCQGHDGRIQLVNPGDGKVISSFTETPAVKGQLWAHPAIAGGRLYIRNGGTLKVFDIKGR